ncbi:MAG: divalent-cation tolerance protein CutA [Elusimicrobia bacterium]|nr:divalent-cation tolerance protein CutA [Elusimicrobiota bacterium]
MIGEYIVCLITVPGKALARRIAEELVRRRAAACVNILGGIESVFFWQGKIDKANECLLIAKTTKSRCGLLRRTVENLHPYDVPEIIALGIAAGNRPYLEWISNTVRAAPVAQAGKYLMG